MAMNSLTYLTLFVLLSEDRVLRNILLVGNYLVLNCCVWVLLHRISWQSQPQQRTSQVGGQIPLL